MRGECNRSLPTAHCDFSFNFSSTLAATYADNSRVSVTVLASVKLARLRKP
jgi:hypothetical protein